MCVYVCLFVFDLKSLTLLFTDTFFSNLFSIFCRYILAFVVVIFLLLLLQLKLLTDSSAFWLRFKHGVHLLLCCLHFAYKIYYTEQKYRLYLKSEIHYMKCIAIL